MAMRRLTIGVVGTLLLGGAWMGGVSAPPFAAADPNSDDPGLTPAQQQFVNDLTGIGITSKNGGQALVNAGQSTYNALLSGSTHEKETNIV